MLPCQAAVSEGVSGRTLNVAHLGGLKFYERVEIKLVLDYLRVIYNPDNNDALVRIINRPKRGIGDVTVGRLLEEAETSKRSLWKTLLQHCQGQRSAASKISKSAEKNLTGGLIKLILGLRYRIDRSTSSPPLGSVGSNFGIVQLVEELIDGLDLRKHIQDSYPEEHEGRLANLDELITLVGDFVRDQDLSEEILPQLDGGDSPNLDADMLGKFLANVALAADAQTNGDKEGEERPLVTISTIHAAKGLEWPVVFVPAVYNGSLPHARAEERDEERRLLYVAMTRAQALLYLSLPWFGNPKRVERSEFVPDEAVKLFALKGPSFEQGVLETMGKILGREAPSMKGVYGSLPKMFNIEDDAQPDFPDGYPRPAGMSSGPPRAAGRGKTFVERDPLAHERNQMPWQKEYATTMEQASTFTTALPGFTTAGAHHSLTKAAEGTAAKGDKAAWRRGGATTKRAADQGSLASFVKREGNDGLPPARKAEGPHVPQRIVNAAQVGMCFNQPLPQNVVEEMTHRGLQHVKRRVMKRRSDADAATAAEEPAAKKGKYPGFSSSPPRPASPEKENLGESVAAKVEAEDRRRGFVRPAVSLHATTMGRVGSGAAGRGGVSGLAEGGGGVERVERVRKPFRPLTIARNGNLGKG